MLATNMCQLDSSWNLDSILLVFLEPYLSYKKSNMDEFDTDVI